jgi:hypothetical protein
VLPPLKYLLYTPSYHSLHHSRVHTNFCLFMPLYDYVYGTASPESDSLHASAWQGGRVASDKKPDVVSPCCTPLFHINRNMCPEGSRAAFPRFLGCRILTHVWIAGVSGTWH